MSCFWEKQLKLSLQFVLLIAALAWCVPAHAIYANTQHKSATGCAGSTCNVPGFTAIPTGSFIGAVIINDGNGTQIHASAGASQGGTWVIPSGCTTQTACEQLDGAARSVAFEYVLSSTGTPTSIDCQSTGNFAECAVFTVTFTSGPVAFDVGNVVDRASGTNVAGLSPGTLTGSNDLIIQFGSFSASASACTSLYTAGCTAGEFPNGNGAAILINTSSNTAGNWTNAASTVAMGSIAFKETGGAATAIGLDKRRRYEALELE